jgi:signal transduction histidine kinase
MTTLSQLQRLLHRSRRTYALGIAAMLIVLVATVLAGWLTARMLVRQLILQRDADLFYATTLMEQLDAQEENGNASLRSDEQVGFDAAIRASRLRGVMGIRFFTPSGQFTDAFPANIQPLALDDEPLRAAQSFQPRGHYQADTPLSDVLIYLPSFRTGRVDRVPIVEVTVPLHRRDGTNLAGVAQFLIEGQSMLDEFRALDRHLAGLAGQTLLIAGVLLAGTLWLTFGQVERLNSELTERNERLLRANEELAMAAKTSAVGAVSAHLMHGLKNPLASLSDFVRSRGDAPSPAEGDDWQDAINASRRMQALVEQTLEVLADTRGQPLYQLSTRELAESVRTHLAGAAAQCNVRLSLDIGVDSPLSSRVANLLRLILTNLVENAIAASPPGKPVRLGLRDHSGEWEWTVADEGPGFPHHLRPRLFLPCKSTREGGSGIGLTLCKQLADHLGATLDLTEPATGGCVFRLRLRPEPAGTAET